MKRYFHSTQRPGSVHCESEYNYLALPDGSFIIVMMQEYAVPEPSWTELPHLLEQTALPAAVVTAIGALVAATPATNTFQLARMLAAHNPRFHP